MAVSTTAAWAEAYAAVGWRLFPLPAGGKVPPAGFHWKDWASGDAAVLRRWFPDDTRNLAAVTGETFDALDVEAPHLPSVRGWLAANGHELPTNPLAVTGRGGWHILVSPTGYGTRKLLLNGVHIGELKAAGGYILVSPSRTVGQYTWLRAPAGMATAPAPDWLLALVAVPEPPRAAVRAQTPADAQRRLEGLAQTVARAHEGNRNELLFWAACRGLEEGIPQAATERALLRAALDAGLAEREARATLGSASRKVAAA